ncbi:MAG: 2OG-Fe(II) oxygenase [Myxococcota bacterium]
MTTTLTDDYAVFDDFLSDRDREPLWTFVQMTDYRPIHHEHWAKDWRLHDGSPMRSTNVLYERGGDVQDPDSSKNAPLDLFARRLMEAQEQVAFLSTSQWKTVAVSVFLYPPGSGLSWHADNPTRYAGSFIYYAHPQWNVEWGGELMIHQELANGVESLYAGSVVEMERKDGEIVSMDRTPIYPHLDNSNANRALLARGRGEFLQPVPNRLVLLRSPVPHRVAQVTRAAGMNPRISIGGFFLLSDS